MFYLCDPSPLALYDACDHPTTSGGDHIDTVIYKRGDLTEERTQVKFGSFFLNMTNKNEEATNLKARACKEQIFHDS